MSRDSTKQQIFEACGRIKSAAEVLKFLIALLKMRKKDWPDEPDESPRLLLDIPSTLIADKTHYSLRSVERAIALLRKREFITIHYSQGEVNRYQINSHAVSRWIQPMPLFEQDETIDNPRHGVGSTPDTMSGVGVSPCRGYPRHGVGGSPYMSLHPLTITTKDAADECFADQEKKTSTLVSPVPAHDQRPGPQQDVCDTEREKLIEAYRAIGFAKEQIEAHLTKYTRQRLQAALECLQAKQRRGARIYNPPGFLNGFIHDPGQFGYELDPRTGHWRPAALLHLEAKQIKLSRKARDSPADPEHTRRHAMACAWDQLSYADQTALRTRLEAQFPHDTPPQRHQRCQAEALALHSHPEPHGRDQNQGEAQGELVADRMQGAPRPGAGDGSGGASPGEDDGRLAQELQGRQRTVRAQA